MKGEERRPTPPPLKQLFENNQFYFVLVPTPEAPKTPLSPEPKLMSDNVATMSLLSASECHLAALQDEDGDT